MHTTDASGGGKQNRPPDSADDPSAERRTLLTDPLPPLPPDGVSGRLLRLACRLGKVEIVGAVRRPLGVPTEWVYEGADSPDLRAALALTVEESPPESARIVESVEETGDPPLRDLARRTGIASYVAIPIRVENQPSGTLIAVAHQPRVWTSEQLDGLSEVAAALGEMWLMAERSARVRVTGEHLYDLLDRATDMVVSLAPDGTVYYANKALRAALGYRAEELVGRRAAEFVAPERHADFAVAAERIVRKGEVREFETALLTREGSRILVAGSGNCRYDGETPVATRLFFRDVTEERAVEAEVNLIERIAYEIEAGESLVEGLQRSLSLLGEYDGWRCAEAWFYDEEEGDVRRIATWCAPDADARYPGDEMERCIRNAVAERRVVESPSTEVYAVPLTVMDSVRGGVVVEGSSSASTGGGAPLLKTTLVHIASTIERRRAEAALIESRTRLADFLDRVADLVVSLTPGGRIRYANRAWRQSLGYGDQDPKGTSITVVIPEGLRESALRDLERLTPGSRGVRLETELRALDGSVVEVVGRVHARRDLDGQVSLEGIFTNESARKRAERDLRETEQRLRSILRTMQEGILLLDREGNPLFGNPAAAEILRLSPGSSDTFYDPPEWSIEGREPLDYMQSDESLALVLDSGQPVFGIERALEHPDGTRTIISFNASPQTDEAGEVQAVVVSFRDVTEQKGFQERLRERERQLSEAQAIAEIGSWEWDLQTGEVRWSDELLRIFGHRGEGELNLEAMVQAIAEHDRAQVAALIERVQRAPESFTIEYDWVTPQGATRTLMARGEVVHEADGRPVRLLGVTQDVTRRRQQEAELRRARDDAQAAARAKSEFLANMSHEIRTPLAGIAGMTDLLLGTDLSARQGEYVDMIRTSGEALVRIIDDILDVSRVEAGKLSLHNQTFPLRHELEATVRKLSLQAEQKGLRLSVRIGASVPARFHADLGRLTQILNNLIGNAIKFTNSGEVVLEASLDRSDAGGDWLHLAVRDTGIGIPARKLRTIFEPFAQADSSTTRRFGGTGLGLSISSKLAGLMGGRIDVESEEGVGSTFHVHLPVHPPPDQEEVGTMAEDALTVADGAVPVREDSAAEQVGEQRPLRVLVAEDNPVNQHFIEAVLTAAGHEIELVADGRAAVERALTGRYDVVLMDVQMPEMGGIDATKRIREEEAGRSHLPIVAVTAHALQPELDRCIAAGMDSYLTKPFSRGQLLEKLQQVAASGQVAPDDARVEERFAAGVDELISRLGDTATLRAVGPVLLAHAPGNLARLEEAVAAREPIAANTAHTLRGSISLFGAEDTTAALREIETAVKEGRWADAARGVGGVHGPLERLLELVRRSLSYLEGRDA